MLIAAAVATLADAAGAQCPDGSPPPCGRRVAATAPAPAQRTRHLMFLPFRNVTRRAEHDWLTTGAPLMLGQVLGQFRDLHVVTEEQLSAARRRLRIRADSTPDVAQMRHLAEETGGWTAITGTIISTGARLRIGVVATDVPSGRALVRAERDVDPTEDVRVAFDALALRVLEPSGVAPGGVSLTALTTTSIDAYRAYVRGLSHYHAAESRNAVTAFEQAVRLDTSFALAWSALALSSVSARGFQDMMDPRSILFRAIERASRSLPQLPPADAALIRMLVLFTRAQLDATRTLADSAIAAAPDNIALLEIAASFAGMGTFLGRSTAQMTADANRAVVLARRVIELDPGRRMVHSLPIMIYGLTGGLFWGMSWADSRPFTSLPFMLLAVTNQPQATYVPLLRDSIVLVPLDSFAALPDSVQRALRRPGADRAMQWVEEWLVAGADDAEAHLWAARIAELQGDYRRSLREFEIADSIGIQTAIENTHGRRLSSLVLTQQHRRARALADSLLTTGAMAPPPIIPSVDRRWQYGAAALLLSADFEAAGRLALIIQKSRGHERACESLGREVAALRPPVPRPVRAAIMDTVRAHLEEFRRVPALASCEQAFTGGLNLFP